LILKQAALNGLKDFLVCYLSVLINHFEVISVLFYPQSFLLTEFGLHQVYFGLQMVFVPCKLSPKQDLELLIDRAIWEASTHGSTSCLLLLYLITGIKRLG
jgi:hypothetical protein